MRFLETSFLFGCLLLELGKWAVLVAPHESGLALRLGYRDCSPGAHWQWLELEDLPVVYFSPSAGIQYTLYIPLIVFSPLADSDAPLGTLRVASARWGLGSDTPPGPAAAGYKILHFKWSRPITDSRFSGGELEF